MAHQNRTPCPVLKPYIKCFWSVCRVFVPQSPPVEVLPDSYRELIFSFRSPCILVNDGIENVLPHVFAVNLLNEPLYIRAEGELNIFGVRLYPWVTLDFLKASSPVMEVPRQFIQLHQDLDLLGDQQGSAIFTLLEQYFVNSPGLFQTDRRLLNSCQSILDNNGVISASAMADAGFTSQRNLERIFQQMIGQTPKGLARKVRFEFIRNLLWAQPETSLTTLAYELNFTDLAHFSHEFRYFSKKSPAAFAKEALNAKKRVSP